jgi:non-heme chloroperoxidase
MKSVATTAAIGAALIASCPPADAQSNAARKPSRSGPFIDAEDGTRLFHRDWGEGAPILFCHPWALNADIWEYQLTELSERGLRCIAYDRRGHGRSEDPGRGYDYDTLAADLAAVIEHLDLRDVTLVGYSMGSGEVARYLSRHGGGLVSRVVLVSPVAPVTTGGAKYESFIAGLKKDRPASIAAGIALFLGDGLVSSAMSEWVNAPRSKVVAANMRRRVGSPCSVNAAPITCAKAITSMNSGSASSLAITPWVPKTNVAPKVTKLPVTYAVNSPAARGNRPYRRSRR